MKVIYAKTIRELIDEAILEAEKQHRRIERIALHTLELVDLYDILIKPHGTHTMHEWFAMKEWRYRGVKLTPCLSEEDI